MSDMLPRRFEANGVMCVWEEDLLKAEAEVARLTELLRDVATSGQVMPDRRMHYTEVQIDWQTWDALEPYRKPLTLGRG
ncbi:MAG: hypothetical protein WC789_09515 [Lentisphaeria bacterium]